LGEVRLHIGHWNCDLLVVDIERRTRVQSIFRYPGGKTRRNVREWITSHRPDGASEYREPFVGGGGVFFHVRSRYEQVWINDKHTGLMEVYAALRDRPEEFIGMCREIEAASNSDPMTEEGVRGGAPKNARLSGEFDQLKLNKKCDQALRYYFVNRTVHGSGRVNYDIPSRLYFSNPNGWNIVTTDALDHAAECMEGVRTSSGDYRNLFEANGKDVWIYADPPYVINTGLAKSSQLYQHGFSPEDHKQFAKVVKACKHRVCISYDNDEDGLILSLFSGKKFHIVEGTWKYAGTSSEKKKSGRELLILNYEPPTSIVVMEPAQQDGPLDSIEVTLLEEQETAIAAAVDAGKVAFVAIGKALAAIRDSGKPSQRIYRATHDTFEEYCRDRWGFSKRRANQFIDASGRYGALEMGTIVPILPSTESQVRELSRCESDDQAAEVWQQVVESADDPIKITALDIHNAVNKAIGYVAPDHDYLKKARAVMAKLTSNELDAIQEEFFTPAREEIAA
jgi:DNA adenine methylase